MTNDCMNTCQSLIDAVDNHGVKLPNGELRNWKLPNGELLKKEILTLPLNYILQLLIDCSALPEAVKNDFYEGSKKIENLPRLRGGLYSTPFSFKDSFKNSVRCVMQFYAFKKSIDNDDSSLYVYQDIENPSYINTVLSDDPLLEMYRLSIQIALHRKMLDIEVSKYTDMLEKYTGSSKVSKKSKSSDCH